MALQANIQVQPQILARRRRFALQGAQDPALGVDLHLAIADAPVQYLLVGLLQPVLADEVRAPVIGRVDAFDLFLVDAGHIAQDVGRIEPQGIGPQQIGADIDRREAMTIQGDAGDLLLRQMQAQGHRRVGRALTTQPIEALDIRLVEADQLGQLLEEPGHILGLVRRDGEGKGGLVGRQQDALGVVDETPHRRQGLQPHPVVLGQGRKMLVAVNLQMRHPRHHQGQEQSRQDGRHPGAAREQSSLAIRRVEPGSGHGVLSPTRNRAAGRGSEARSRAR